MHFSDQIISSCWHVGTLAQGVIPETAPFMVWRDKVMMDWDEERLK